MKAEVIVTEDQLPPEVLEAIKRGQKVEAIKLLRESTGLGLANAKVLVDRVARTHAPKKVAPSFVEESTVLGDVFKFAVVILIAVAVWYYF